MSSNINQLNHLGGVLTNMHEAGMYSDAILTVRGREFPIHRNILACQSPFFDRLLYRNEFDEGHTNNIKVDACPNAFLMILKYFYSAKMDLQNKDIGDVYDILELAHRYDLTELEKALIVQMEALTNISNLHWSVRAANLFESRKLKTNVWAIFKDNQIEFFEGDGYLKLSHSELIEILSYKDLALTMIEKFQVISKWIQGNSDDKKDTFLKLIDLSVLSNRQIKQIVEPTQLFDDSYLKDFIWKRVDDVEEESPWMQNWILPEFGTTIVVGESSQNTKSTSDIVIAKDINGNKEIILNLGQVRVINCLKFNLGERTKTYSYSIKFSLSNQLTQTSTINETDWADLRSYQRCRSEQTIYFAATKMSFIRIQGADQCYNFYCSTVGRLPEILGNFIAPKENIFTPQNATIFCTDSTTIIDQNAITWDFKENGTNTSFTDNGYRRINFLLHQPYFLKNCRFRLWDFDRRRQSFELKAYKADNNLISVKEFERSNGWHTVQLEPQAYLGFEFSATDSKRYLKIVHFEASGLNLDSEMPSEKQSQKLCSFLSNIWSK